MARIIEHVTEDVDDQAKVLNGFRQEYEQLGCGRFRGAGWQLVMADGLLLREQTNRPLRERVVAPADHLVLAMPLAVEPGSVYAGRPLARESLMVLSGCEEFEVVSAGELDLIGLSVHREMLATLAPSKLEWIEHAERERNLELTPDVAAAIRAMLVAVAAEAGRKLDSLADTPRESELLRSTLSHAVVLAMNGDRSDTGASTIPRRAHTRLQVVRRAIEFMRAHLDDDIGVPEICAAACASRRTLQYCFEEFLHTTPQAYLRAIRLNEARRALKLRADQPITSVASAFGFSSASQFTRHYKLMFDELPSETLKLHCYGPGNL